MKIRVESRFDVPPEQVWGTFDSPEFHKRMAAESGMQRKVLEQHQENGIQITKTEVKRSKVLPRIAAKVLGTKTLTYIQTNRFDAAKNRLVWNVEIPAMGGRLHVSGVTSLTPTATGCDRLLEGDVTVRVRLVGRAVERAIGGEFQKTAARAVEIVHEILRRN
jgi:hypothetical protein